MDILISEELAGPSLDALAAKYQVVLAPSLWKDPARLKSSIRQARVIVIRNQTNLTAEMLSSAPQLIGIGRLGVGLDNIDVATASNLGIVVISPLNANATSVAELTLGLLLALVRKIPLADRKTKNGEWDRKGAIGMELAGKTLGIFGFGRIGRLVAIRARAFGLKVLVFDPYVKLDPGNPLQTEVTLCQRLEEMLPASDMVTVHAPSTPETRHIFNPQSFSVMKSGAYFINTSRGGLVDEQALLDALRKEHLGGAALDVREIEPPATKIGFEALDNVILTPHIGAATIEAQTRTFEAVAADVDRLLLNQPAINFVNFPMPTGGRS